MLILEEFWLTKLLGHLSQTGVRNSNFVSDTNMIWFEPITINIQNKLHFKYQALAIWKSDLESRQIIRRRTRIPSVLTRVGFGQAATNFVRRAYLKIVNRTTSCFCITILKYTRGAHRHPAHRGFRWICLSWLRTYTPPVSCPSLRWGEGEGLY